MHYLTYLPSLICGIAVCYTDLTRLRIPRAWIAWGCALQTLVFLVCCAYVHDCAPLLTALLFSALTTVFQAVLAMAIPGSLGFGDVTLAALLGLSLGYEVFFKGLATWISWWLYLGLLGLAWILAWHIRARQSQTTGTAETTAARTKAPFAPVMVCAAVLAILV